MKLTIQRSIHTLSTILLLAAILLFAVALPVHAKEEADQSVLAGHVQALAAHVDRLLFQFRIAQGVPPSETLNQNEMEAIMEDGLAWLYAALEKEGGNEGHYRYEYAPYEGEYIDDDNIVRQAGTFYQVGEKALYGIGDAKKLETILSKNAAFFEELSGTVENENGERFRCITRSEHSDECKLGATSLALVGLLSFVDTYPEYKETYDGLVEDYANYILASKKVEGGFRDRHYIDRSVQSSRESSFSNGEAMLALARYYKYDPRPEIEVLLQEMFAYIRSSDVPFDSPLYLWAMAALRDMQELWPNDAYLEYAQAYTWWRLDGFSARKNTRYNMCAYVEGIGSAYALLSDNNVTHDLDLIAKEIDFWLLKTADLQIHKDERYRAFETTETEGALLIKELTNPAVAHGGFLTSYETHTQRIDYTQHCLNAYLLRYNELY